MPCSPEWDIKDYIALGKRIIWATAAMKNNPNPSKEETLYYKQIAVICKKFVDAYKEK